MKKETFKQISKLIGVESNIEKERYCADDLIELHKQKEVKTGKPFMFVVKEGTPKAYKEWCLNHRKVRN